jgi:hypothetical protein
LLYALLYDALTPLLVLPPDNALTGPNDGACPSTRLVWSP